jgi:hypothetical protein
VNDFVSGTDKINLAAFANIFGNASFVTASSFGTANTAQFRFDATNNNLLIDSNGDGTADITVKLTGVTSVSASDFVLS